MAGVPPHPTPEPALSPSPILLGAELPPVPRGWTPLRRSHSPAEFLPGMPCSCLQAGWIQPVIKGRGMSLNPLSRRFPIKNNSRGAAELGRKSLETVLCHRSENELKY